MREQLVDLRGDDPSRVLCLRAHIRDSVRSFGDARPRGVSGVDFEEKDQRYVADMLRHLHYEHGQLRFYATTSAAG